MTQQNNDDTLPYENVRNNRKRTLNIGTLNCNSIKNKSGDLIEDLKRYNLKILALQETKAKESSYERFLSDGYTIDFYIGKGETNCKNQTFGGTGFLRLRNESNIFITNLAVADLVVTSFVDPLNVVGAIEGEIYFYNRGALCEIVGLICLTSCFGSLMTIDAISFNRFLNVCYNDLYKRICNKRNNIIICICLWVLAFLSVMPTMIGWGDMIYDRKTLSCIYDRLADYSFTMYFIFGGVGIPVVTMAILYFKIYWVLRKSENRVGSHTDTVKKSELRDRRDSVRLAKTLLIVFIAYVICWTPYAIVVLVDVHDKFSADVHTYAVLFAHINSSINFIIYGMTNRRFRTAYINTMKTFCCRCKFFHSENNRNSDIGFTTGRTLQETSCN